MALSLVDGTKDEEPERAPRAWAHVAEGCEAAFADLEPGDEDYGRMLRMLTKSRGLAGQSTLGTVSSAIDGTGDVEDGEVAMREACRRIADALGDAATISGLSASDRAFLLRTQRGFVELGGLAPFTIAGLEMS